MTEILRYVSIAIILLCIPGILWALWDRRRGSRELNLKRGPTYGSDMKSHDEPAASQTVKPGP